VKIKTFFLTAAVFLVLQYPSAGSAQQRSFLIRAVARQHGTISPSGWITVRAGSSQTFTITPDKGYRVKEVRTDWVSQGPLQTYTFTSVQKRHRIVATFVRDQGQSDFSSALPRVRRGFGDAGAPGSDGGGEVKDTERSIEEGDIVKQYENTLLVLNQYRGLQLIDITDRNNPALLSTVPVYGYPVELYVRSGTAYVVISSYFNCWYNTVKAAAESFSGSRIVAVDVRDRKAPQITGAVDIEGSITDTRLVGSIIYAVASQFSYYYYPAPEGANRTSISAVSIADPAQIQVVDQMSFPMTSSSYQNSVHVTPDSIFLAQYGWGYVDANGSWVEKNATDITCIDISDAAGAIRRGATFTVPGVVMNRWQMDYYNGYFRAITPEQYWGNGYPSLYIYRVDGIETITLVSSLTLKIDRPEALMSVRFDGAAAYAVTYEQKDPLFTIDLTDPAQPRQLAEIQMSGWIDYLEPKPGHLVALGHDDVNGMTTLAVSLFDVERVDNPVLVQRVTMGEGYGWLPTDINNMHKAFRVLDDLQLILVPFSSWSYADNRDISGVQLIDYFYDSTKKGLAKRGLIDHAGWIERALAYDRSTILTVSSEAFQTVDISDRDQPAIIKVLELARNAVDISGLTEKSALELSTDIRWYSYDQAQSRLSVVPLDNPDTPEPLKKLDLAGSFDRLFSMRDCTLASGSRYDEKQGNRISIKTLSYDGEEFTTHGFLEIPGFNSQYWLYLQPRYYPYYPYGSSAQAQKISDTALIYAGYEYRYENFSGASCAVIMKAVDVSERENPRLAATIRIDLKAGTPTAIMWTGARAYISYAEPLTASDAGAQYYKCYYKTVDFTDINSPVVSESINIPGYVAGTSTGGKYLYTLDYQYAGVPETYQYEVYLNTLEPAGNKAYLLDRKKIVPAPQDSHESWYCGSVRVKDEKAYYVINHSACSEDYSSCQYDATLITADLSDPANIQFPSSQALRMQSADIVDVVQDKLFLYTYSGLGGIIIYGLRNPGDPAFETFYRTDSYPAQIKVINGEAYLPSGMYGVKVIPLQ
jgi:hypothetical protein